MDTRDLLNAVEAIQCHIGDIDAESAARLLTVAFDLALVIDRHGVIADLTLSSVDLQQNGCGSWIGRRWIETVTSDSRQTIEEMLGTASHVAPLIWREVNHPIGLTATLAIRYAVVRLGASGKVVAIGHDMRASTSASQRLAQVQQTMEHEHAQLRHAEARYRLLFDLTAEAVLILKAATTRIVEANKAASSLLGLSPRRLTGQHFPQLFHPDDQGRATTLLTNLTTNGREDDRPFHLATNNLELTITASHFRQHETDYLLVRLTPSSSMALAGVQSDSTVLKVLQNLPDGFVIADLKLRILSANTAFFELIQVRNEERVCGEPIDRWVGRHPGDMATVVRTLQASRSTENFSTVVRGEDGTLTDVEIAAVAALTDKQPCIGMTLRPIRRLLRRYRPTPLPTATMTNLVGEVPLSELVQLATEMIERQCVQAALEVTADNRAAAAELLGLSRQGFYNKLHRYRIVGFESDDEE